MLQEASCLKSAFLFAWVLSGVPALFASQIVLPSPSGAAGATILVPVGFASQASSVSGIQFDVQFDNSALSMNAVLGDQAKGSGKSLYSADLEPNTKRLLIVGLNQNGIQDGTLVNLQISISPSASSGMYALRVSNVAGTDAAGHVVSVTSTDGAITVQGTTGNPQLQPSGVRNGASWAAGPVAPGELISLIGTAIGPASAQQPSGSASSTDLGGTSVLFDGTPAPLLYAGPNQINAVVPYGVSGKTSTQIQLMKQKQPLLGLSIPVAPAVPAIFTLDSTGGGPGAILNQDSSVNSPSNPAAKGSIIAIYATGAGQTNPAGVDGQVTGANLPQPLLGVSVQIGGVSSQVKYAGAAPGLISGALQVNAVVPYDVPSGPAVPVVLVVATASSPAGVVTVAIQ